MTELRLHREIYARGPVDEAAKTFESYATITVGESDSHWLIGISAKTPARERQIQNELANFALGLTVKELQS